MIKLNEEILKIIKESDFVSPIKVDIEGIYYYVKKDADFLELVGEELARIIGLKCAHYEPLVIDNENYVISRDLASLGVFEVFREFRENGDYNLYNIWNLIEEDNLNSETLMRDVVKMYVYDYLFMNSDRNFANFGLLNGEFVILDNGEIFDNEIPPRISSNCELDVASDIYQDIAYYLESSDDAFIKSFIEVYDKVTPEYLESVLDSVEDKWHINLPTKKKIITMYKWHYINIEEIIKKYRGEDYAR